MRTLSFRHCLLAYLALASLLLGLSLQMLGGAGMDRPMSVGQTGMMEMSDPCDACDAATVLDAGCVSFNWSCAQLAVTISSSGLTALRPAAERLTLTPLFHAGLSPAPELRPPRGVFHV